MQRWVDYPEKPERTTVNFTKLLKEPFILSVGSFTAKVEGCMNKHLVCMVSTLRHNSGEALRQNPPLRFMLRLWAQNALRSARTGLGISQHSVALKICLLVALFTITASSGAAELGRLFFTPEQRAQLEYSQQKNVDSPTNVHSLTVNGIVQKHGGERTVWVNGVPQIAGKSDELAPESLPVAVPGQSKPVKVKVGQKVLINPAASSGQ